MQPTQGRRTAPTFRTSDETNAAVRTLGARVTTLRNGRAPLMDVLLAAAVRIAAKNMPALVRQIEKIEQEIEQGATPRT